MKRFLASFGATLFFILQVWGNPFAPIDLLPKQPNAKASESQAAPEKPKYSGFWTNDGIITAFVVHSGFSIALQKGEASNWGKVLEITTEKIIFEKNGKKYVLLIDR